MSASRSSCVSVTKNGTCERATSHLWRHHGEPSHIWRQHRNITSRRSQGLAHARAVVVHRAVSRRTTTVLYCSVIGLVAAPGQRSATIHNTDHSGDARVDRCELLATQAARAGAGSRRAGLQAKAFAQRRPSREDCYARYAWQHKRSSSSCAACLPCHHGLPCLGPHTLEMSASSCEERARAYCSFTARNVWRFSTASVVSSCATAW